MPRNSTPSPPPPKDIQAVDDVRKTKKGPEKLVGYNEALLKDLNN